MFNTRVGAEDRIKLKTVLDLITIFFRIDIPIILKPELKKPTVQVCVCEQIIRPTNEVYRPKRVNGNAGTLGVAKI